MFFSKLINTNDEKLHFELSKLARRKPNGLVENELIVYHTRHYLTNIITNRTYLLTSKEAKYKNL